MLGTIFKHVLSLVLSATTLLSCYSAYKAGPYPAEATDYGAVTYSYGSLKHETMDVYIPYDVSDHANVLFLVHGGGWMMGSGEEFNDYCKQATEEYGYITVNFDYQKLQNGANVYDMVDEMGMAVEALKNILSEKGITADNMIVAAHSAGANIALLYCYQNYVDCPINIAFIVSNSAPTEFLGDSETQTTTMGKHAFLALSALSGHIITDSNAEKKMDYIKSVSPLYYVNPDVPPTIVVQGDKDEMVPYQNSTDLYNALVKNGVDTIRITYEGAGHFLGSEFKEGNAERKAAFDTFAEKYLK